MTKETLFALSLFPYLGFLWFVTKSQQTPRLSLIGFYVLLVFVAVTIPAGIYAKRAYGLELANVDWLHGSAEFFLTLSNILVVLGFRQATIELRQGRSSPSVIRSSVTRSSASRDSVDTGSVDANSTNASSTEPR
ncbi:MAG: DUF3593 domain-containing protein [Phormidesmis sp.]